MALIAVVLWLILFMLSWPIAIVALLLYPLVWLILVPFRIVGIAVDSVLETLRAVLMLPARVLGGRR